MQHCQNSDPVYAYRPPFLKTANLRKLMDYRFGPDALRTATAFGSPFTIVPFPPRMIVVEKNE